jgi:hypothetical protein
MATAVLAKELDLSAKEAEEELLAFLERRFKGTGRFGREDFGGGGIKPGEVFFGGEFK